MKKFLLAGAAVLALASGAHAADLGSPRMPIAAAVVSPVFNWTGFYLGGQIGYSWGRLNGTQCSSPAPATCDNYSTSPSGFVGGIHAGYNWQFNQFVLGLEGDLEYNALGSTGTFATVNSGGGPYYTRVRSNNAQGSIRARAGFAVDRALFYVTGGAAVASFNYGHGFPGGAPFHTYGASKIGWTLGAGVEYAFTPNWTARVEYRYANFGSVQNDFPGANSYQRTKIDTHTVRVGVSYLFSTGPSAVVARY